jgi:hypothetical protein
MKWLKEEGLAPTDVAHLHCGWDIECGDDKFEVKGRKSFGSMLRLTQNEWNAAKKLGKRYMLLVFTAPTKTKLTKATPRKIPDPFRTATWKRKETVTYEYFLDER